MTGRLWMLFGLGAAAIIAAAWFVRPEPTLHRFDPSVLRRRPKPPPGAIIFARPTLHRFKIELAPEALDALRRDGRKYASAKVTINGRVFTNTAIHLKGAAGSFRGIDDRPALTLSFGKNVTGRRWNGLRKIHLNNSVQDSSYMNEYLASQMFRAANVPTPRVAFATVELNGRSRGLYVLKEGFTKDFLKTFFTDDGGNLYDGGFLRDIDQSLDLDEGPGSKDLADLEALVQAAQEPNKTKRWQRLNEVLDVESFLSYLAVEIMIGDWDGYPLNRNNYRIYFNPADHKAIFLPHGMDQVFQRSDMEIRPWFTGMVAQRLMETDEGRRRYEERIRDLFFRVYRVETLTNTIAGLTELLRPVEPQITPSATYLRQAIQQRYDFLKRQPALKPPLPPPPPPPPPTSPAPAQATRPAPATPPKNPAKPPAQRAATPAPIPLPTWEPVPAGEARLEDTKDPDGTRVLQIIANQASTASWRTRLKLKAGNYRLEARARTSGVQATRDDKGEGAGIRISNGPARTNHLAGDTGWTRLAYDFKVQEPEAEVTLVCELRASRGRATFDLQSLQLLPQPR